MTQEAVSMMGWMVVFQVTLAVAQLALIAWWVATILRRRK